MQDADRSSTKNILLHDHLIPELTEYDWDYLDSNTGGKFSHLHSFTFDGLGWHNSALFDFGEDTLTMSYHIWGVLAGATLASRHKIFKYGFGKALDGDGERTNVTRYNVVGTPHQMRLRTAFNERPKEIVHELSSWMIHNSLPVSSFVKTFYELKPDSRAQIVGRGSVRTIAHHAPLRYGYVQIPAQSIRTPEDQRVRKWQGQYKDFRLEYYEAPMSESDGLFGSLEEQRIRLLDIISTDFTYTVCWGPRCFVTLSMRSTEDTAIYNRQQPFAWYTPDEIIFLIRRLTDTLPGKRPLSGMHGVGFITAKSWTRSNLQSQQMDYENMRYKQEEIF